VSLALNAFHPSNVCLLRSDLRTFAYTYFSKMVGHLGMVAWTIITFTMVVLAVNRYVAITRPMQVGESPLFIHLLLSCH
jgi:hypothetical protein